MESSINDYQLKQGNMIYVFSTSTVDNLIRLSCKTQTGKKYSRDFTVYELNSIDQIFNEIKSESEAINFLDKALKIYKVGVREESGIIKIIFYITAKGGLMKAVEISLGEPGNTLIQSELDNLNSNNSLLVGSSEGTNQQIGIDNINSYGQQLYYSSPTITPVEPETTADSNYNYNASQYSQYISQYQTNGGAGGYEEYQNGGDIGTYALQDNNQYTYQTTSTSGFGGEVQSPADYESQNEYNSNFYQYSTSTDANYYPSNYTTYQTSGTSYETKSYDIPQNYSYTTNQYSQPSINTTTTNVQTSITNQTYNNSLPVITPVEPEETTNNLKTFNTKETYSNSLPVITPVEPEETTISSSFQNQEYNTQYLKNTNIKSFPQASTITTTKKEIITTNQYLPSPSQTFTSQKKQIQVQNTLQDLELQKLKNQIGEIASLKKQLAELNSLKAKVAELNSVKSQLGELNDLKQQVGKMNIIKKQIEELNSLRTNKTTTDLLKKRMEELEKTRLEYEKQIKTLREKPQIPEKILIKSSKAAKIESRGLESKQITFEDKSKQIAVRGEIIHSTDELELLIRKINKSNNRLTLTLLYKATADSDKAEAFHEKCDDARSTLVLVETTKGKRFGGYTTCSWSGDGLDKKDEYAFIFSLDKMKIYENISGEDAIGCYPKYGPIFLGCQIRIFDDAFTKGGTTFEKGLNYNTEEDYELNDGEREFIVKEIEVYEVFAE